MRGDEVGHSGSAHHFLFVLEGHQEEGSDRHQLPSRQEEHTVARDHEKDHGEDEQVEESGGRRKRPVSEVVLQVAPSIDRAEARNREHAEKEEGSERVEGQVDLAEGERPRDADRFLAALKERRDARCRPEHAPTDGRERSDGEGRAIRPAREERGDRSGEKERRRPADPLEHHFWGARSWSSIAPRRSRIAAAVVGFSSSADSAGSCSA